MHRHTRVAVLAALLLAATACTSSSDDPDTASSSSSSPAGLAAEWGPKLQEATTAETAVCNQVGDQACAEHLTNIAIVVTDLEQAIDEAGGQDAYPRTVEKITEINKSVDAYTEHECLGDENAGISGSPCPDDARTIMTGGAQLPLTLETDEAKNG
ncbi:hypothetical protein [Streptomyces sp. A012304]|uniref:hypothetical protein n=1 Tax=Streptomyces sp. A012304 TaxID=375446 RepID=UPI002231E3E7|nr:hypothetical protein [Streptomyces sp. A012304]GKQ35170.1 hypothetical protein ALMP_17160 [Streptomyces sp. A012304]